MDDVRRPRRAVLVGDLPGTDVDRDRLVPRRHLQRDDAQLVVLIGAVLLGLELVLARSAQSLVQFQLTYGVVGGLAASARFAPIIAATTAWFQHNRSLAVSLVSTGMGVAPMTSRPSHVG